MFYLPPVWVAYLQGVLLLIVKPRSHGSRHYSWNVFRVAWKSSAESASGPIPPSSPAARKRKTIPRELREGSGNYCREPRERRLVVPQYHWTPWPLVSSGRAPTSGATSSEISPKGSGR